MARAIPINEPHLPYRPDIEEPLLKAIIQRGGAINFSKHGRDIEIALASHFGLTDTARDFHAPNYHSRGNRKWRNHLQFVRDQLVKKRELDNSTRNIWLVTAAGYRRVGMPKA